MNLRRRSQPAQLDPEFVEVIDGLYYAFEDNLERCFRLTELRRDGVAPDEFRDEALAGARRIAYVSRVVFLAMANLVPIESIPDGVLPFGVHGALARLAYALVALAEEEPEPEALLSPAELEGLAAQYEIETWVGLGRERNPEFRSEDS
jgi:hypothetical protein